MSDASTSLPLGVGLLILAIGVIGLLLVFSGHRLLTAICGLGGLAIGTILGWAVGEVLLSSVPTWIPGLIGGAVGVILGALCSRLAAASALAAVLALVGWLSVASADRHGWLSFEPARVDASARPTTPSSPPKHADRGEASSDLTQTIATNATEGLVASVGGSVRGRLSRLSQPLYTPAIDHHLGTLRDLVGEGVAFLGHQWTRSPVPVRTLMLACAAACGFLGLCVGILAARWTAATITALGGSVLVVLCAAAAIQQFAGTPESTLGSRLAWMIAWGVLALAGLCVQWFSPEREPAAKRA